MPLAVVKSYSIPVFYFNSFSGAAWDFGCFRAQEWGYLPQTELTFHPQISIIIPISLPTSSAGFRKRDNTECVFGPYVCSSHPLGLLFFQLPSSLYSQLPFQSSDLSSELWTCHPGTHFQRVSNMY